MRHIIMFLIIFTLSACAVPPSAPIPDPMLKTSSNPRIIILSGKEFTETDAVKFVTWQCTDYVNPSSTLVEVGKLQGNQIKDIGFILYDGDNTGDLTLYHRKGLNHRWDWNSSEGSYTFIIKPDGTGLFYDFSAIPKGESKKADDVYMCKKK